MPESTPSIIQLTGGQLPFKKFTQFMHTENLYLITMEPDRKPTDLGLLSWLMGPETLYNDWYS